jgi:hypothetical protein
MADPGSAGETGPEPGRIDRGPELVQHDPG